MRIARGFTLIELLIYVVLFSLTMVGVVYLTRSTFDTRARSQANLVLEDNVRSVIGRIARSVHGASSVSLPASGASSTSLTLVMTDAQKNPTVISLNGGTVNIKEGNAPLVSLTPQEVEALSLTFTHLIATPDQVRVDLTTRLKDAVGPYQASLSVTNTLSIRR